MGKPDKLGSVIIVCIVLGACTTAPVPDTGGIRAAQLEREVRRLEGEVCAMQRKLDLIVIERREGIDRVRPAQPHEIPRRDCYGW